MQLFIFIIHVIPYRRCCQKNKFNDNLITRMIGYSCTTSIWVLKFCSVEDKEWGIIIEDPPYIICSTFKIKGPSRLRVNDINKKF
jgi:hypothetical protein